MSAVLLERLCIHQVTLMQCGFGEGLDCLARHAVPMTAVWHEKLDEIGVPAARRILRDSGVVPVALSIGGFLTSANPRDRRQQVALTCRRIDACAALGIPSLVMLTGGLTPGEHDLQAARARALEAFAEVVPQARAAGVRLVLEPLHPMVCGYRSVLSTLGAACDFLRAVDADDVTGLVLDTYALWWDLNLPLDIQRAAPRLRHLHVSDWLTNTTDIRLDRGMPGDGLIDNKAIRSLVEESGFDGPVEIEILSKSHWWTLPAETVVATIIERAGGHL